MSIREISYYIREQKNKFSKEEIVQQLREKGYAEDEIEEAFLFDQGHPGAAPFLEKDSAEEHGPPLPQTIWAAIKQRQSVKPRPEPKTPLVDWERVERVMLTLAGLGVTPVLYYVGVLSLFFLQLFWPVPEVDPLVLLAGAILVSMIAGIILKSKNASFSRGVFWGVGVFMVVLAVQIFKSNFNQWPFHLFK